MVTRVSGTIAVGALFFALSVLLSVGIEVYDDTLNEFSPPRYTVLLFLAAPAGWLILVDALLFMAWYWFLSGEIPQSKASLLWHILGLALAAILVAIAMAMTFYLTHLDGHVSPTPGRWVVNALITGGLAIAVYRAWKRSRPPVR